MERETATTGTVASQNFNSTGLTAFAPAQFTSLSNASFNANDVYTFKYTTAGLGVTLTGFLVTIEYIPSD